MSEDNPSKYGKMRPKDTMSIGSVKSYMEK
jgi:hypothetical protein